LWGLKHGKISLLRLLFSSGLLSELCFHYLNIYASLLRKVSKASQSFSKNQDVNIINCAWNTWTSFEPILSQCFIFVFWFNISLERNRDPLMAAFASPRAHLRTANNFRSFHAVIICNPVCKLVSKRKRKKTDPNSFD